MIFLNTEVYIISEHGTHGRHGSFSPQRYSFEWYGGDAVPPKPFRVFRVLRVQKNKHILVFSCARAKRGRFAYYGYIRRLEWYGVGAVPPGIYNATTSVSPGLTCTLFIPVTSVGKGVVLASADVSA